MIFAWDRANSSHIAKHGVTPREAEFVVENTSPPFPDDVGDGKRRVWGPTSRRRMLQVIYVLKKQNEVPFESISPVDWAALDGTPDTKIVRVIHAMELTDTMKRQLRRRRK